MSEWQSIETAPKDGTVFVTWGKSQYGCNDFRVYSWFECMGEFEEWNTGAIGLQDATHWMPLPPPPIAEPQ